MSRLKLTYTKESTGSVKRLMPFLLGMAVCIICLMGTTWSWFTVNVTTTMQSVKAADYRITVDIPNGEKLKDGSYRLYQKTEGEGYLITVKASGSASTGYFKVSGPEGFLPLYSAQMAPGEVITFSFYPGITGIYDFESAWGTYSGENTFKNNDIIGTPIQSEESINGKEEVKDAEMPNDTIGSTPATKPNEDEGLGSDGGINNDTDGELDKIPSTVEPSEVPGDIEEAFPPHASNGDGNLVEGEQPTLETTEEISGNTEQK